MCPQVIVGIAVGLIASNMGSSKSPQVVETGGDTTGTDDTVLTYDEGFEAGVASVNTGDTLVNNVTDDLTGGEVIDDTGVDGTALEDLQGQIDTLTETNLDLMEKIDDLGGGDKVTETIQNVTYNTVVQNIEQEQELIKAKKAEQLRKAVLAKRRIGEVGRASLITGSSGGIGYSSGLQDTSKPTPSNIKRVAV